MEDEELRVELICCCWCCREVDEDGSCVRGDVTGKNTPGTAEDEPLGRLG